MMKRTIALLTALVLCVSLCGCAALDKLKNVELPPLPTAQSEETESPETIMSEETASLPEEQETESYIVVGITENTQEFFDQQNGTRKILTFSYETPEVYVNGNDAASEAINEYIARLDETYVTGNDYGVGSSDGLNIMLEQAQDNYYVAVENNADLPLEFSSDRTVQTARTDERCLALLYRTYTFTGGAHGNYVDNAYVFDPESGELVTLDKLSSDSEQLISYLTECMLALVNEDKDQYYTERLADQSYFVDTTMEEALKALVRDTNWYFDNNGMCIFSDLYEIAPYAAGIVEFDIPYDMLSGHIDEKWMKTQKNGSGSLTAMAQSDIQDGSVEIIDRVAVSDTGAEIAVAAEGTVYQAKLCEVEYVNDGFIETKQLWAAGQMKDCVLQIVTDIPDGMPNLMISYLDASGASHDLLITQSGQDGSIILMDKDSVRAQG